MSTTTANLGLFKYDTNTDSQAAFNINTALNENWDKIDNAFSSTDIISTLKIIYPVGCVYLTTNSTCPLSSLFGTWSLVSSGRALWTGTGSNGNTTIAAGLPNIVGTLSNMYSTGTSYYNNSGAFGKGSGLSKHGGLNSGTNYNHDYDVDFHASYYNTIYSDSVTTVQPPAYVVNVFRRTA